VTVPDLSALAGRLARLSSKRFVWELGMDSRSLPPEIVAALREAADALHALVAERALSDALAEALREQYVHNCERGDSVASVSAALVAFDAARAAIAKARGSHA
jgi:hypothetical protein